MHWSYADGFGEQLESHHDEAVAPPAMMAKRGDFPPIHSNLLLNFTSEQGYDTNPSANVFHQTEWVDVNTISITLVANAVVCLLALIYFWSSRRHHPGYFTRKRAHLPDQTPEDLPSSGFLSWIPALLSMSENELLEYAGFDAAIFLRFYSLAFKVFATFTPYAVLVLIPVNMSAVDSPEDYNYASNINNFNRLSMSNIQADDRRIWLHALGLYLLTAVSMYFLVIEYRYYTNLRHLFLRRKSAHQRTIVVEGVPKEMRSDSKLFTYFNTLYPNEVVNVHIPMDLSLLRGLIRKRQGVLDNLARGLEAKGIRGEEQYHYTGEGCCRRRRVRTVEHYTQELKRLNLEILTEQDKRIPRNRRRPDWGPSLPSISSVDMNYDLGSTPALEAGPIERVVLQEDPGEGSSESEGSDELSKRVSSGSSGGGGGGEDPDATSCSEDTADGKGSVDGADGDVSAAAAMAVVSTDGAGTGSRFATAFRPAQAPRVGSSTPSGGALKDTINGNGGFYRGVHVARTEEGIVENQVRLAATAQLTLLQTRRRADDGISATGAGLGLVGDAAVGVAARERLGSVSGMPGGSVSSSSSAHRFSDGDRSGGGVGRSRGSSPKRPATDGGLGLGATPLPWPSAIASTGTRLSVDLINVDPLGEAVKNTAQTLKKNIREKSFQYRTKGYGTGSAKLPAGTGAGGGSKRNLLSNGKQHMTGAGGGSAINDSSSGASRNAGRGFGNGLGYLTGNHGGGGGGGGGGIGESASLLSSSASKRRTPLKKSGPRYSSRAFVTFRSFSAATVARQVLHCARPGRMAASSAPEARDIYWPNAIVTRRQHTVRRLCVEILLGGLMIFFPVLVSLLSVRFSAENIINHSEVVKGLCNRSSLFQSMIELIQPTMVISVMATLPVLLRWVGHFEGILAESMIQMQTLSRFFSFQVLNVFLVTTIAGFAVEILTRQFHAKIVRELIDQPSRLFTLLGETLPKVCGFFCDYVIIRAFTGMSMELVRAYNLFPGLLDLVMCKKKWGNSPSERRQRFDSSGSNASSGVGPGLIVYAGGLSSLRDSRLWSNGSSSGVGSGVASPSSATRTVEAPQCFFYGQLYAQDLLVVVVVMTYACVAPVVLLPALMFFSMAGVVYRHQLVYVYVPKFESGGSFFPKMFRRWIFALFTAQATMVGMCLLKNGVNEALSVLFLMVLTYAFKRKVRAMYEPVSFSLPLEIARGLDLDRAECGPEASQEEDEALHPAAQEYLQPELRAPAILRPEDLFSSTAGDGGGDETFGQ